MKTIRHGKSRYTVQDDPVRIAAFKIDLEKASKLPTPRAARAKFASRKDKREFPQFSPGDSVEKYVTDYYALNHNALAGWTRGSHLRASAKEIIAGFFEPLSTLPMFAPSGEVIEETLSNQPA